MIDGLKDLDKLIRKLQNRETIVSQLDGQEINLKTVTTFVPGPYLHQDVKDENNNIVMTEQESAEFERDNTELFNFLRDIENRTNGVLN